MFIKTIKNICKRKNTKINNNKEEDSCIVFYFDKNSKKIYCNCNFKFHEDLDHEENIKLSEEYALFCYLFGLIFVKFGWYEADIEITNRFNLFVKEMRHTYKTKKFK